MKVIITSLCFALLLGCGSLKKSTVERKEMHVFKEQKTAIDSSVVTTAIIEKSTSYYGDTLQGGFPISEIIDTPQEFQVESGGQTLRIRIDNKKLTYSSVSKPVHVSSTRSINQTAKEHKSVTDALVKQKIKEALVSESERKPWKFPMWLIVLLVVVVVLTASYFFTPLKTILKPLKTLLK